jgi:hypothetical protein
MWHRVDGASDNFSLHLGAVRCPRLDAHLGVIGRIFGTPCAHGRALDSGP